MGNLQSNTIWSSWGDFKKKSGQVVILNKNHLDVFVVKTEHHHPFCYGQELKGLSGLYGAPNTPCLGCEFNESCEIARWRKTEKAKKHLKKLRRIRLIYKAGVVPVQVK